MTPTFPRNLLVLDLEATCSNTGSVPRHESEIIEIGACMVSHRESADFQILEEFDIYVKPAIHPTLTEFCTELISIQQKDFEGAVLFPEALCKLREFVEKYGGPQEVAFLSWGDYDKNQFVREAGRHGLEHELERTSGDLERNHFNVKRMFAEGQGLRRGCELGAALMRMGMGFEGTAYRAIDDARNIVRLLEFVGRDKGMLYWSGDDEGAKEVVGEGKGSGDEQGGQEA